MTGERQDLWNKKDSGKVRVELVPVRAILWAAKVFAYGASSKYKAWSWVSLPQHRTYASALRHLYAWRDGERLDPESGMPHLAHALTNVMMMLEIEDARTRGEEVRTDGEEEEAVPNA